MSNQHYKYKQRDQKKDFIKNVILKNNLKRKRKKKDKKV